MRYVSFATLGRYAVRVVTVLGLLFGGSACVKWERENYIMEGGSYWQGDKFFAAQKQYFAGSERVVLKIPSTVYAYKPVIRSGSPYRLVLHFEPGREGEDVRVITITDFQVTSSLDSDHGVERVIELPIVVRHRPDLGLYTYALEHEIALNFAAGEELTVFLRIESKTKSGTSSGTVTLKAIPLLDRGWRVDPFYHTT